MKKLYFIAFAILLVTNSIGQSYEWKNVNLQGMGFVTGIAAHQNENDVVFCRTDVGGLYRWKANERQWEPVTDGKLSAYGVEAIALDPMNAAHVYAAIDGKMYESTDQGTSWKTLAGFPKIKMNGNGQYRFSGKRLLIDPNNNGSAIYLVTHENGLLRSLDKGQTWLGISAAKLPFGNQTASGFYGQTFVAIDKTSGDLSTNSKVVYVGVQGMGVYKSTDSGENWTLLTGGPDKSFKPVCGIVGSDGSLYVTYSTAFDEWADGKGKIYTYTSIAGMKDITPANNNGLGFIGIDANINDPRNIVAIQWKYGLDKGIHYSEDAGKTWNQKQFISVVQPKWYPDWVAWGYSGQVMFDPFNAKKIWLTNGFGVYVSDDITRVDTQWHTEMQGIEEFVVGQVHCPPVDNGSDVYSLQMDQIAFQVNYKDEVPGSILFPNDFGIGTGLDYCVSDPNVIAIVGSDQNIGTTAKHRFTTDGGITWKPFGSVPPNADNGNIAISASNNKNWVWVPRHNDGPKTLPHYSLDQGKTWQQSKGIPNIDNGATHLWAMSLFLQSDKVDGNRFYYYMLKDNQHTGVIYRSDDGGATFNKVYFGLPSNYKCKLKAMPGKAGNLFFYTNGGDLLRSPTGGDYFVKIPNVSKVKGIGFGKAIAPSKNVTIFLAATYKGKDGVFRSTDDAQTWTEISASNVPHPIIADMSGDPRYEGLVYLATGGRGIIYGTDPAVPKIPASGIKLSKTEITLNVNETFQMNASVLPVTASNTRYSWKISNRNVATLTNGLVTGKLAGQTYVIATAKDGSFTDTCMVTVTNPTSVAWIEKPLPLHIYPNPVNLQQYSSISMIGIYGSHAELVVSDINGRLVGKNYFSSIKDNQINYSLPTTLKPGIYLISLNTGKAAIKCKLVVE